MKSELGCGYALEAVSEELVNSVDVLLFGRNQVMNCWLEDACHSLKQEDPRRRADILGLSTLVCFTAKQPMLADRGASPTTSQPGASAVGRSVSRRAPARARPWRERARPSTSGVPREREDISVM